MPRFFVNQNQIERDENNNRIITIRDDDANHIGRSLRMRVGDSLVVCDGNRTEYECVIQSIHDEVKLYVQSSHASENEPPYDIVLYQALAKGDKFDSIVQKAVECGVTAIVPVSTQWAMMLPDEKSMKNKLIRWRRIAKEAAGQSRRGMIPEVRELQSFEQAINDAGKAQVALLCYEEEKALSLPDALPQDVPKSVSIFIGPEGGLSPREVDYAKKSGLSPVSLGRRILRTETASGFVLSCLSFRYEL